MSALAISVHLLAGILVETLILVEVTDDAGGVDAPAARVISESCNEALERSACVPAGDVETRDDVLRVRVRMRAQDDRAALTFAHADGARATREIDFRPDDPPQARQRAVGLVIAAYWLERPPPPEPTPPPAPTPEPTAGDPRPRFRLDLGVLGGPGLDRGSARFGGLLRGGVRLGATPLHALLSGRAALRPGDPEVLWLSLGAGLSVDAPLAAEVAVTVHASAIAERISAGAAGDSDATARFGAVLGAELALRPSAALALFAGAELALAKRLVIDIDDEIVGEQPPLQASAVAGLRF